MTVDTPIPMILHCPECRTRHIDEGEFATRSHATHACQGCGLVWRPAIVDTVGVQFLPGFKNESTAMHDDLDNLIARLAERGFRTGSEVYGELKSPKSLKGG